MPEEAVDRRRSSRRPTSASWPRAGASCRSWPRWPPTRRSPPSAPTWCSRSWPSWARRWLAVPTRTPSRASPGPKWWRGWSATALTRSWPRPPPPSRRSTTSEVLEAVPDAAVDNPESLDSAPDAPPAPAAEPPRQAPSRGHGSSTVRVDAERLDQLMHAMGELVLNRTHVEGLAAQADVPGLPQALQAPHPHAPPAAGDGHAGPHDPRRGRAAALPAARPRPLRQAVQAGRAGARRQGHRARPQRRRLARRPARAPDPQLARPRPRRRRTSASPPASPRPAAWRSPPATPAATSSSPSRDDGRGVDPAARRPQGVRARADLAPRPSTRSTWRAPPSCSSIPGFSTSDVTSRHLRPRRRHGRRAGRDPRPRRRSHDDLRARRGHDVRDPPAADAGDHVRAARAGRRARVRDPAGPHRAHRAPRRPDRPLRRGPAHAGAWPTA